MRPSTVIRPQKRPIIDAPDRELRIFVSIAVSTTSWPSSPFDPFQPENVLALHLFQAQPDEIRRLRKFRDHLELERVHAPLRLLNLVEELLDRRLDLGGLDDVFDERFVSARGLVDRGLGADDPVPTLQDLLANLLA